MVEVREVTINCMLGDSREIATVLNGVARSEHGARQYPPVTLSHGGEQIARGTNLLYVEQHH